MKTKEDWYSQWLDGDWGDMLSFTEDIQKDAYNSALEEAASHVTASIVQSSVNEGKRAIVNKNTILNLKK